MNQDIISITGLGSVSGLGPGSEAVWNSYTSPEHRLTHKKVGSEYFWVGSHTAAIEEQLEELRKSSSNYGTLDLTALLAILASRLALKDSGWQNGDAVGINIGSSRGTTELFERYYEDFLSSGKTPALTSPNTTLGNISFWVAQDLQSNGPAFSHSITCSTAMHAVLNGVAWLRSGLSNRFLVGGSEAALTPFTLAQLQGLRIYSREKGKFPSRAMDFEKSSNTMILGSGAAMACMEVGSAPNAKAYIEGIGYATEVLEHPASLSANAGCIQDAMRMAMQGIPSTKIDVVIMHAPGTVKGDYSELNAIREVFGKRMPALTGNKWKIGHTFGASGMFSLEMAVQMLMHQEFIGHPFEKQLPPKRLEYILVNAVGFGGNAVSVVLRRA